MSSSRRSPGVATTATRRFALHDAWPGLPPFGVSVVIRSTKSPSVSSPAALCA